MWSFKAGVNDVSQRQHLVVNEESFYAFPIVVGDLPIPSALTVSSGGTINVSPTCKIHCNYCIWLIKVCLHYENNSHWITLDCLYSQWVHICFEYTFNSFP